MRYLYTELKLKSFNIFHSVDTLAIYRVKTEMWLVRAVILFMQLMHYLYTGLNLNVPSQSCNSFHAVDALSVHRVKT